MSFDQWRPAIAKKLKQYHKQFVAVGGDTFEELKQIDWQTADLAKISSLAKTLTGKATKEGIKVGAHYLGEVLGAWGLTMGGAAVASGGATAIPAAITTALGAAMTWGADLLIDAVWPKESEGYEVGDFVVINKHHTSRPSGAGKEGLRRRLPDELIDSAIVTGEPTDGYVELYNFRTGNSDSYPIDQVAKVSQAASLQMRSASKELANAQDLVRGLAKQQRRGRRHYHHRTKVGDLIEFQGNVYEIKGADWEQSKLTLFDEDIGLVEVEMGDEDLSDLNLSKGPYFSGGDFAWLKKTKTLQFNDGRQRSFPYRAVAIRSTSTQVSEVVDVFDGEIYEVENRQLCLAPDLNQDKSSYANFLTEVADLEYGDRSTWRDSTPGRHDHRAKPFHWVSDDPHESLDVPDQSYGDLDDMVMAQATQNDHAIALAMDNYRDLNKGLEPVWPSEEEPGRWSDPEPTKSSSQGNTTLLLIGGAAALVAIYAM